ncbi:FCD domain-containing protein [Streptomyces sp. NPDC019208]|uniref:FadR/GntR family transcriptional regulator n=1 Tax=Streptomyces sp. NPDC019208 TaxID=3154683 RepID=UPI0033F63507
MTDTTVRHTSVSRLRNAGLVEPRQGRCVFVRPRRTRPLDLDTEPVEDTKAKVLQIVEVRRPLEGEAAYLAASRATPGDLARMRQALDAIDAAVAAGGDGVDEDLAFHRSIAESTGNAVMVSTVRYLGEVLRGGIRVTGRTRHGAATSSKRCGRSTTRSWPPSRRATPTPPAMPHGCT